MSMKWFLGVMEDVISMFGKFEPDEYEDKLFDDAIINKTLNILKDYEGFSAKPYQDGAGVWTIGYGTTRGVNKSSPPVTKAYATELMRTEVKEMANSIEGYISVYLTDGQAIAILSLVYNIGIGGFKRSTVLRRLNKENFTGAANAILMWDKITVNGKKVRSLGLANRREKERNLFLTA